MEVVYNLIISNIYLYICIIIGLLILTTILLIISTNQRNRRKIKDTFVEAEKVETALEEAPKNNELENLIKKMQEDMEVKPEDVVKSFEKEQEEKAIISYQELVENVNSGKIEVIDDDESNINFVEEMTPIENVEPVVSINDNSNTIIKEQVKEVIENISKDSIKEEPKQFKQSEFISPIYGRMETKLDYPTVKKMDNSMDIMNTRDYNELTEEIKRQEDFLNTLKEFRNNL